MAIRNQDRFNGIKTLVISGERGEESKARANYAILEPDRANLKGKREVDRYRPIRDWQEIQVWDIIKKYKIVAHPCYYMGFSRCSCKFCIFGNADQFASANLISPCKSKVLQNYEQDFGVTLKRTESIGDLIQKGTPYESITEGLVKISTSKNYTGDIFTQNWILPSGAFGQSCGPS